MWYVLDDEYDFKDRENKAFRTMQRIQKRAAIIIVDAFRIIFDVALDIEIYLTSIKIKLDDSLNNVLLRVAISSTYIYIFSSRALLTKRLNSFSFLTRLNKLFKKYVKLNSLQKLKYRYEIVYQNNLKELKHKIVFVVLSWEKRILIIIANISKEVMIFHTQMKDSDRYLHFYIDDSDINERIDASIVRTLILNDFFSTYLQIFIAKSRSVYLNLMSCFTIYVEELWDILMIIKMIAVNYVRSHQFADW